MTARASSWRVATCRAKWLAPECEVSFWLRFSARWLRRVPEWAVGRACSRFAIGFPTRGRRGSPGGDTGGYFVV
jgi:hypothetical protein